MMKELTLKFAIFHTIVLYVFLSVINLLLISPYLLLDSIGISMPINILQNWLIITPMVGLSVTYSLTYFLLKKTNRIIYSEYKKDEISIKYCFFFIFALSIGLYIIKRPFFEWKTLLNIYFNTSYQVIISNDNSIHLLKVITILIINPFCEEFFFRYYIFNNLVQKYTIRNAMIFSSILFASIHFVNPNNLIPTFLFGLVSCILFLETRNIYYSIIFHSFMNLLSLIPVLFIDEYNFFISFIGKGFLYWFIIFIAISICWLVIKNIHLIHKTTNGKELNKL